MVFCMEMGGGGKSRVVKAGLLSSYQAALILGWSGDSYPPYHLTRLAALASSPAWSR